MVRAIYMASTGGDTFGTINPPFSWFLLSSEIIFSGITVILGIIGYVLYVRENHNIDLIERLNFPNIVISTGIMAYSIHFIRVAIWILLW